jgi:hypothetical protein
MNQAKKDIIIGLLLYIFVIVLLYYLWKNNVALSTFLIVISIAVLFKWSNREEKIVYFASFILGPIIDIILVPKGVWTYGSPTMFNIPVWLPFTYGVLTVTAIKIGKSIAKLI